MPDQDAAETKAFDAARAISAQVGALWMSAHCDGVRNGMEAAAVLMQGAIDTVANDYSLCAEIRDYTSELLSFLRDGIRIAALQLPEPGGADG